MSPRWRDASSLQFQEYKKPSKEVFKKKMNQPSIELDIQQKIFHLGCWVELSNIYVNSISSFLLLFTPLKMERGTERAGTGRLSNLSRISSTYLNYKLAKIMVSQLKTFLVRSYKHADVPRLHSHKVSCETCCKNDR